MAGLFMIALVVLVFATIMYAIEGGEWRDDLGYPVRNSEVCLSGRACLRGRAGRCVGQPL